MSTISDIEGRVLDRLEEDRISPKFWSVQNEVRPFIVEAMNEAVLITGTPEIRRTAATTLAAGNNLYELPTGAIAIATMEGPGALSIRKCSMWDLDMKKSTWEQDTGPVPKYWFPYGLTKFGIYPQLTQAAQVVLTTVDIPVVSARPYTGAEIIPFTEEFDEGFEEYGAHAARVKEGGVELAQSMKEYGRFLDMMGELSKFEIRKESLRFSRTAGLPTQPSPVVIK